MKVLSVAMYMLLSLFYLVVIYYFYQNRKKFKKEVKTIIKLALYGDEYDH